MINGSAVRTGAYFHWNEDPRTSCLARYPRRQREIEDIPTRHFKHLATLIDRTPARERLPRASGRSRPGFTPKVQAVGVNASRASQLRTSGFFYEYLDRERVIDHIGAVAPVVLVRLDDAGRVPGAGQQRVLPRLLRRQPIKFPASPCMSSYRVYEFCLGPGSATVGAHRNLRHIRFTRPCSTVNRVDPVWSERFINTWSRNLGFELHFS